MGGHGQAATPPSSAVGRGSQRVLDMADSAGKNDDLNLYIIDFCTAHEGYYYECASIIEFYNFIATKLPLWARPGEAMSGAALWQLVFKVCQERRQCLLEGKIPHYTHEQERLQHAVDAWLEIEGRRCLQATICDFSAGYKLAFGPEESTQEFLLTPLCRGRVAQNAEYVKRKMSGYGKANSVKSMKLVRGIEALHSSPPQVPRKNQSSQPPESKPSNGTLRASNSAEKQDDAPVPSEKAPAVEKHSGIQNIATSPETRRSPAQHMAQQGTNPEGMVTSIVLSRTDDSGGVSRPPAREVVIEEQIASCKPAPATQNSKDSDAKRPAGDKNIGNQHRPETPKPASSPAQTTRIQRPLGPSQQPPLRPAVKRSLLLSESDTEESHSEGPVKRPRTDLKVVDTGLKLSSSQKHSRSRPGTVARQPAGTSTAGEVRPAPTSELKEENPTPMTPATPAAPQSSSQHKASETEISAAAAPNPDQKSNRKVCKATREDKSTKDGTQKRDAVDTALVQVSKESEKGKRKLNRRQRRNIHKQKLRDSSGTSATTSQPAPTSVTSANTTSGSRPPATDGEGGRATKLAAVEQRLDTVERLLAHLCADVRLLARKS